jgi:hypothetical protein
MNTIDPAAYEGDIVSRLRNWRGLHIAHSGRLYEEAADEIERLRERVTEPMPKEKRAEVSSTLTAEEREAIDFACMNLMETTRRAMQRCHADEDIAPVSKARATLRALLERTQ